MNFNMSNYIYFIAFLIINLSFIALVVNNGRRVQKQNIKFIRLYTDIQFITRLIDKLNTDDNNAAMHLEILHDIENYFALKNILTYKIDDANHDYYSLYNDRQTAVYLYLKKNEQAILTSLESSNIAVQKIDSKNLKCIIYIMSLLCADERQIIICVGRPDVVLENDELNLLGGVTKSVLELTYKKMHSADHDPDDEKPQKFTISKSGKMARMYYNSLSSAR